jgi:hypothetical protein
MEIRMNIYIPMSYAFLWLMRNIEESAAVASFGQFKKNNNDSTMGGHILF